ncbi:dentin sialophosphoprotein-like [Palaemon carinicauda]|uniref:dentin sialophosphoprotein-like n=1 Tax=Palaemon carinicauda TaxID=392227 RepID=UPI0035B57BF4
MPKVFGWAKKLSGHSSKSAKHAPTPVEDSDSENTNSSATQSPEKKPKALESDNSEKCSNSNRSSSSINNQNVDKKSLPTKRPSFIRRLSPEKRSSTDSTKVSPENGQAPDRRGGLEKRHNSDRRASPEKRPSAFAQRFASFRIGKQDKSSKSKSKSPDQVLPETEVLEKNNENGVHKHNVPPACTEDSSSVTSKENVKTEVLCDSSNMPPKDTSTAADRISTPDQNEQDLNNDSSIIRSHNDQNSNGALATEKNINPRTSRVPTRQSISEKLYGEVIKEFDKIRTIKPKVAKKEAEASSSDDLSQIELEKRTSDKDTDKIVNSRFTVSAVSESSNGKSDSNSSETRSFLPAQETPKEQSCISEHPSDTTGPVDGNNKRDLKATGTSPENSDSLPTGFPDLAPLASAEITLFEDEAQTEVIENEKDPGICKNSTDDNIVVEKNESHLTHDSSHVTSVAHKAGEDHVVADDLAPTSLATEELVPSKEDSLHDSSVNPVEELEECEVSTSNGGQNDDHLISEPCSISTESPVKEPNHSDVSESNEDMDSPEIPMSEESLKTNSEEIQGIIEDSKSNCESTPEEKISSQDSTPNVDIDKEDLAAPPSCETLDNGELITGQNLQLDEEKLKSTDNDSSPLNDSFIETKIEDGVTFKDEMLALLDKTFLGNNVDSEAEVNSEITQKNSKSDRSLNETTDNLAETELKIDSSFEGNSFSSKLATEELESQPSCENISEFKAEVSKEATENGLKASAPERKTSMPASLTYVYSNDKRTDDYSSFDESYEESYKEERGSSLPSSPLVPRRKKKPRPVPAARTFYTPGSNSGSPSAPSDGKDKRSNSCNTPPARPPVPHTSYSLPPVRKRSSTVPCKPSETSNNSVAQANVACSSNGDSHSTTKMTSTDCTTNVSSYSKSLNPFDSDEDEETNNAKDDPKVDMQSYKSSKDPLNPFDSDDDEVEDPVKTNVEIRKIDLPPAGYNPFDEEDEENENSGTSETTSKDASKNPFDEHDEDDMNISRDSPYQQSFVTPDSSPFRRESVRASLPNSARILSSKKKRQAPLPPGYGSSGTMSACTTPLLSSRTALFRGDSYSSLDRSCLRKCSATSYSTLSLSSPKKTPPPRPPPPKTRAISLAQLK